MKDRIMVIGGYGEVGRQVAIKLCSDGLNVIIAGRNEKEAKALIQSEKLTCSFRRVDVSRLGKEDFGNIHTVVMCLEKNNIGVLDECIKRKINYIDVTPSYTIIQEIEQRRKEIMEASIRVGVGIGIAPGISNVLAENLLSEWNEIREINTYLMLGLGERHGKNAISWFVNNLNRTYDVGRGQSKWVRSFTEPRKRKLIGETKARSFVRIDLADWHLLSHKYPNVKVNSWFAYDVDSMTKSVTLANQMGLFYCLKFERVKRRYEQLLNALLKLGRKIGIGTDRYAVMVEAIGVHNSKPIKEIRMIEGRCNSKITGEVCALCTKHLQDKQPGIYDMSDLVTLKELEGYQIKHSRY